MNSIGTTDKPDVSETENGQNGGHASVLGRSRRQTKRLEQKAKIDAAATAPGLTRESFAHLDEKKILRKVKPRATSRAC